MLSVLDFSDAAAALRFDFDGDPGTPDTSATAVLVTFDGADGSVVATDGSGSVTTTIAALAGQDPGLVTAVIGTTGDDVLLVNDGHSVALNGGADNDTLRGGGSLSGGQGDDVLRVAGSDISAGLVLNGGDGIDTLEVGDVPFSEQSFLGASLGSIERVIYLQTSADPLLIFSQAFSAAQIGGGLSATTFWDWTGHHLTRIDMGTASSVDLSGFTFGTSALTGIEQPMDDPLLGYAGFQINGDGSAESMTGSAVRDTFNGFGGNDTMRGNGGADLFYGEAGADVAEGGAGDDRFVYRQGSDVVAGERIDGGEGTDTLVIQDDAGTGIDFRAMGTAAFTSVEQLFFRTLAGPQSVTFGAVQFSGGNLGTDMLWDWQAGANITVRIIGTGNDGLDMSGFGFSAGALANLDTSLDVLPGGFDVTALRLVVGSDIRDRITGTALDNTLSGGGGADIVSGGLGADVLSGGDGNDRVTGNNDATTTTDDVLSFLNGDAGEDTLFGNGHLDGGADDDVLQGGDGYVTLDGGAGDDVLTGGAGINAFISTDGADTITGGSGSNHLVLDRRTTTAGQSLDFTNPAATVTLADGTVITGVESVTFHAGTGNDTVLASGDVIYGGGGDDSLTGDASTIALEGGTGNDVIHSAGPGSVLRGDDGNDTITADAQGFLYGGAHADDLTGSSGADVLDGGTGADRMEGGGGSDLYTVDNAGDIVVEGVGGGTDTVEAYADYVLHAGVEDAQLRGSATQLTGNALDNILVGLAGSSLDGADGDYDLRGLADSTLVGGLGDDTLVATAGSNLDGGTGDDRLVTGGEGNVLTGGTGNDTLQGEITLGGTDTAVFSGNRADYDITAVMSGGFVVSYTIQHARNTSVQNDGTDTVSPGIEFFRFADGTLSAEDLLDPVNSPATISGTATGTLTEGDPGAASGTLTVTDPDAGEARFQTPADLVGDWGTFGFDSLTGQWTYRLSNAALALTAGQVVQDLVSVTSLDGSATETITITVTGVNNAASISGSNAGLLAEDGTETVATGNLTILDPDAGEARFGLPPSLDGTFGTFTFDALTGDWTYTLDNSRAATQALAEGETQGDVLNVVSIDGTASQVLTVSITGNNDAAVIGRATSGKVTEDATPDTTTGTLTIADIDGADSFVAVADADSTLGYGRFSITAAGVWTYALDNANAAVDALATGQSLTDSFTVLAADGTAQSVTVTIHGADEGGGPGLVLFGTARADLLTGGTGDDFVLAYGGRDTLEGQAGSDTLLGWSGIDSLYGGSGDDELGGGTGADLLDGGTGFDIASYRLAVNAVRVDLADPASNTREALGDQFVSIEGVAGSEFSDLLGGDAGDNLLSGEDGNDQLLGQDGDDSLIGGDGFDRMTGGAGADVFVFLSSFDSTAVSSGADRIMDFAADDLIDLSAIDADATTVGNAAFVFVGGAAFTAAGQVRSWQSGGNTYVALNLDATPDAEMIIRLNGLHTLGAADFVL